MSTPEHCSKCRFFSKRYTDHRGDCRRYPPTVLPLTDLIVNFKQKHPQMQPDDWCGEFRFKDKFIDLVAQHKPDTNVIAPDFTTTTESFDPVKD